MNMKTIKTVAAAVPLVVGLADQFGGQNLRAKVGLASVSPWLFVVVGAAALYYVHK